MLWFTGDNECLRLTYFPQKSSPVFSSDSDTWQLQMDESFYVCENQSGVEGVEKDT